MEPTWHAQQRAWERFGAALDKNQASKLWHQIVSGSGRLVRQCGDGRVAYRVRFAGQEALAICTSDLSAIVTILEWKEG